MGLFGDVAGAVIGTGLGLALERHQDRRQLKQQGALNEQQYALDMRRLEAQKKAELEQWKATGPVGQMEQLNKAGLNPGLIYGMGGGGGQTVGGGSAGSGAPHAPGGGGEMMGMMMLKAQQALLEAQTAKTKAETTKIEGVDTKEAETRIESLAQGITNQKAAARLTGLQGDIAEIEAMIKTESYQDVLSTIRYTARQAGQQLGILENTREISDATKDEKIKIVEGELIGLGLANELKRVQKDLTEEQIKQTVANVAQGWKQLSVNERNAVTNMMNASTARKNAETNVRKFLEDVRETDYRFEIETGKLALMKLINDVPASDKMTVQMISNVLGNALRWAQKD